MATLPTTPARSAKDDDFPDAAIVIIAIGVYLLIIMVVLVVRHYLKTHGKSVSCPDCPCALCSTSSDSPFPCNCWQAVGEHCDCRVPSFKSWLDQLCPTREACPNCGQCFTCSCCYTPDGRFVCPSCDYSEDCCPECQQCPECSTTNLCPECASCDQCCPSCELPECSCHCQTPQCETINCLCCEIRMK